MELREALRHLRARGHIRDESVDPREALLRYQRYRGLPESGVLTPATEAALTAPRCGLPDVMAVGAESAWGISSLAYWQEIRYPNVDPTELAADYALAISRITDVCGLTIGPASSASAAQVVAVSGNIDGPWNVLALSELPPPGNERLTLNQRFDIAEVGLTRAQRQAMMAHEFCHCLGLGHAPPTSGALMAPVLGSVAAPQAWDIAELQSRYGPPRAGGAPPPEEGPSVPGVPVPVTGTGSIITTLKHGDQWTVTLDAPGRYMILVVTVKP